jgi:uncharacterized protein (TIRG00374 family)
MASNKKKSGRSRVWILVLAALIFIFVAIYFSQIRKSVKLLGKINAIWLGLALLSQIATYFASALNYKSLMRSFHWRKQVSVMKLAVLSIVTLFFNQTVPSAQISGNSFLFSYLKKKQVEAAKILSLIVIELLTFYASMEIIVILLIGGLVISGKHLYLIFILIGGFLLYGLFAIGVGFLSSKKMIQKINRKISRVKWLKKIFQKLENPTDDMKIDEVKNPWKTFKGHTKGWFMAIFFQFLLFASDAFTIFILFRGLGVDVDAGQVIIAFTLTKVVSLIPFLPGALVLYESSLSFFLSRLGVPLGISIMATLLYRVLSFWLPMLVGFILYRKLQHEK